VVARVSATLAALWRALGGHGFLQYRSGSCASIAGGDGAAQDRDEVFLQGDALRAWSAGPC